RPPRRRHRPRHQVGRHPRRLGMPRLRRGEVRLRDGRNLMSANAPVVIIGSGLAGYGLAREFRRQDKETPLVVVSRDGAGFYSKPMLSNALAGNKTAAALVMKSAEKMSVELTATVRPHSEVGRIDTAAQTVELGYGEVI